MAVRSHIDDQQVIEYLRANPEFFQTYANELSNWKVEHASGPAVSLIEHQVEALRERILLMRRRLNQLLQTARGNDELFAKVRSLTCALIEVSTWQDLNEVLATNLLVEFGADFVCCHVPGDDVGFDHIRAYGDEAPFDSLVSGSLPVCVALRADELRALFPMQHRQHRRGDGSAVLLPLALRRGAGCLAVGSRDSHQFTRDLDTLFVGYIGEVLCRIVDRLD